MTTAPATEHPVLAVLRERRAAGSLPGARADAHRVALAVEGGGMRGVVSAAMTAAIEDARLTDAFDLVVGSSAGALNGAALLAGVAGGCCAEYAGAFTSRRFINPARLLLGRAAVDVDYVLDFSSETTLDADRHRRTAESAIDLVCVATDVDRAAPVALGDLRTLPALRTALLASSRLPWIGGAPVDGDGRRYLDGGLAEPIPLDTALAAGATHVLVLLTRPRGTALPPVGGTGDRLVERRLRALNPALVDLYRARPATYAAATARVVEASERPADGGPHVLGIWLPEGVPVPGRLERDAERLRAGARAGREAAERVLVAAEA
ncbi:MAG TPA: patatin-like phospholipase family protein [Capillimicrobium sp.]|nr:patatin-like phospholipase family protein [Capillimicrobium sp.]